MNASYTEIANVQQTEGLSGQVHDQALSVQDIVGEAVKQVTSEERDRAERLALLEGMRITTRTEVEPEKYALSVDGVGFFALRDLHAVKGKQKSGKSAVLKVCAAALLGGQQFRVKSELEAPVVLHIDTEQQAADVKLVVDEVKYMTGLADDYIDDHLRLYTLRRLSYDTLLNDTRLLIATHRPQVVFLDGVVDFIQSFNDEVLSRELVRNLQMLCEEFGCAIVCVLHENKSADDENMRGHLGSVLSQKNGSTVQCKKSKKGDINVSCPDARHGTMPAWNISFDAEGHIVDADARHQEEQKAAKELRDAKKKAAKELELQTRLDLFTHAISFNGGSMQRGELVMKMAEKMGRDRTTVGRYLKELIGAGKLFENDKVITTSSQTMLAL